MGFNWCFKYLFHVPSFPLNIRFSHASLKDLTTEKAQPPNIIHKWKSDFNLWDDHLRDVFLLPHSVVLKSYVKAFQYKVLNNILYTNKKLFKIGYRTDDVCTFCEAEPETLYHVLYLLERF